MNLLWWCFLIIILTLCGLFFFFCIRLNLLLLEICRKVPKFNLYYNKKDYKWSNNPLTDLLNIHILYLKGISIDFYDIDQYFHL